MLDVKLKVNREDLRNLQKIPDKMNEGLFSGMQKALQLVEKTIKSTYLSGRSLKKRSGRLAGSIGSKASRTSRGVVGEVGTMRYGVEYGPVWEHGGRYPRTLIAPKKAKALRFFTKSGAEVFAMTADIPPRIIKARPFIMPAIQDNMTAMLDFLGRSASESANK
jgi:hypothetical protein